MRSFQLILSLLFILVVKATARRVTIGYKTCDEVSIRILLANSSSNTVIRDKSKVMPRPEILQTGSAVPAQEKSLALGYISPTKTEDGLGAEAVPGQLTWFSLRET